MRTRPPISPRTITRLSLAIHQAIPDIDQDWFTRKELLNALRRVHLRVNYRQLSNDISLLKSINCPYLNHLKNYPNLSRQSVECLIAFRWLVKQSNRRQACLSINYAMENLPDYEQHLRPENPSARTQADCS